MPLFVMSCERFSGQRVRFRVDLAAIRVDGTVIPFRSEFCASGTELTAKVVPALCRIARDRGWQAAMWRDGRLRPPNR